MKNLLTRNKSKFWWYDKQDVLHEDSTPPNVCGDLSGVWGDLSCVRGDLSGVCGNLSGVWGDLSCVRGDLSCVRGNLSGVRGNLSGVRGDLDQCEITPEDREKGINVEDLIAKEQAND